MNKLIKTPQDWFEEQQRKEAGDTPIPKDIPLLELAEKVVPGEVKLSPQQIRVLIELLPFHAPKLSSVALGYLNAQDFASRLDRAIDCSERAMLIEGRVIESDD
jgi:hypothetical protein